MKFFWLFVFFGCALSASEVPNFRDLSKCRGVVFLLTTPRSGSNLFSASLSIITRRPISWVEWGASVFDPHSSTRSSPSYNRLGVPLVSSKPLLYRTHHGLEELRKTSPLCNQLIFLTRNPKELLFRAYHLVHPKGGDPERAFIEDFLNQYLVPFKVYESWNSATRKLIYYEDLILDEDKILLDTLDFMGIDPTYFEDFVSNKEDYMARLLESYEKQHVKNLGGLSSVGGTKAIFYSQHAKIETLQWIDRYLAEREPNIWNSCLKRFESKTIFP